MTHSPGKWKVTLAGGNPENGCRIESESGKYIARVFEEYADATLIAAAPELLEAAHTALALLRGSGFTENTQAIIALKAAIAKAEK